MSLLKSWRQKNQSDQETIVKYNKMTPPCMMPKCLRKQKHSLMDFLFIGLFSPPLPITFLYFSSLNS